jgi:hypothetical protein
MDLLYMYLYKKGFMPFGAVVEIQFLSSDTLYDICILVATGPLALPLIGSVLQVALADHKRPYVAFHKLAKKYGNIMSLKLGSVPAGLQYIYIFSRDLDT